MIKFKSKYLAFLSFVLIIFACKDKEDGVKNNEFSATVKILNFDTDKPIQDVGVDFFIVDKTNPNTSGILETISKQTNANGEVIQKFEEKSNFVYSFEAGYKNYIEIDNNDFILYRPNRPIIDNTGNRALNHTLRLLEGGRFDLEVPTEAINAKDTLSFNIYQQHKGKKFNVSFAKIPLSLFEKDLSLAKFPAGFIANEKIYCNYKFSNKGISQIDSLLLSKGASLTYKFKY